MAKVCEIQINVVGDKIDLGDNYALVVFTDDNIKWKCDFTFEVLFEKDAPFEQVLPIADKTIEKKVKSTAEVNRVYKYTVVLVNSKCKLLTLDPIIIVIPPSN